MPALPESSTLSSAGAGRRFSQKYHQFGMYRDTSIMGATKARELEQLRVANEERRAQQALEKLREKEREEREAMALALKVKLRKMNRKQRQLELQTQHEAAKIIQESWKEYTEWKSETLAILMLDSAILIQKTFRGYQGRIAFELERILQQTRCALHCQRLLRGCIARKRRDELREVRRQNALTLQRVFRGHQGRKVCLNTRRTLAVTKIQGMVRSFFARDCVSALRIAHARAMSEKHERDLMRMEDESSRIVVWEERERELMRQEDLLMRQVREETKRKQAQEDGIPLLPWRKRKESFRDLVQEQRRERKIAQQKEEKRLAEEQERKAKEKAEMLAKLELERQQSLRKALRKKEKERKRLLQQQMELQRESEEHKRQQAERVNQNQLDTNQPEGQEQSQGSNAEEVERRRRELLRENRKRIKALLQRNESEQESIRQAAKQRYEEYMEKDKERLEKIRRRAVLRAKKQQEDEKRQQEEDRLKALELEQRRKEKLARDSQEREAQRQRLERMKRKREKKLQEERERMEREEDERKRQLEEKAKHLREQLVKHTLKQHQPSQQQKKPSAPKKKPPSNSLSALGKPSSRKLSITPGVKTMTESHQRNKGVKKPSLGRADKKKTAQQKSKSLSRAERTLLPKVKGAEQSDEQDDPLSRALAWKRAQLMETNPDALQDGPYKFLKEETLALPSLEGPQDAQELEEGDDVEEDSPVSSAPNDSAVALLETEKEERNVNLQDSSDRIQINQQTPRITNERHHHHNNNNNNDSEDESDQGENHPEADDESDMPDAYDSEDFEEEFEQGDDELAEESGREEQDPSSSPSRGMAGHVKLPKLAGSKSGALAEDEFEENCAARVIQLAFLRHSLSSS